MSLKLILAYIFGIVILVGIIVFAGSRTAAPTTSASDPNKPIAQVDITSFDLGKMTVKDIREKVFTITNSGKSDLVLSHVSTSCDCTYAYITANGIKSPKFTMHGDNHNPISVKPGAAAQVEVVYEPAIMPVNGKVERVVSIATNDPDHQTMEFKVKAEVN